MKYYNGLMVDNQADYYTFVHICKHTHTLSGKKVKENRNKEKKGTLGIGRPTKCHFASEWTESLNTIDVTL